MSKDLFSDFSKISAKEWKQKIQVDLKGADYENLIFKSNDGVDIKPFYHVEDVEENLIPANPSTWKICEKIPLVSEESGLKKIRNVLDRGAESLWLIVESEKIDLVSVLQQIDLEKIPVFLEFKFLSPAYISTISRYLSGKNHQLTFGIDIVGNLARTGNWYKNLDSDHEALQKIKSANTEAATLSVDISLYENAGATIPQQLAYAVAHAHEYLHFFKGKTGKITFKTSVGSNYFFEIAKLKALRLVYASIAGEYNTCEEIEVIAFPTKRNKSIYDYNVNMLRTTTECMSAILGGADWISNSPYDDIFREEDHASFGEERFGDRISRNQLLILKHESYFDKIENPASGSFYLENLTRQFGEKALELFKDIEKGGGFLKMLKKGIIQRKIKESAAKEQTEFDKGTRILVGTNKYLQAEEKMKNQLERSPFLKSNVRKTLIEPILEHRLAEKTEKHRLEKEA